MDFDRNEIKYRSTWDRHTDQQNRIENPEVDLHKHAQQFFDYCAKAIQKNYAEWKRSILTFFVPCHFTYITF